MSKVEVRMPKMGESITEGTVIEWLKQPGDAIGMDEPLLEIGTDKVDTEVPSPAEGVLIEILVEAGDTVDVGTVIAIVDTDGDAATAAPPAAEPEPAPEKAQEPEEEAPVKPAAKPAAKPAVTPASGGSRTEVLMPKMGESIMEGTVISWAKSVGDKIELDETLLEIATDKVDTEVPSPAAGIVQEILVPEGETVDVGTLIAVIGSDAPAEASAPTPEKAPAADAPTQEKAPAAAPEASTQAPVADSGPIPRSGPDGQFYSPLVRSIAETEGVSAAELGTVKGSGRDGRVTKEDLLAFVSGRGSAPAQAQPKSPAAAQPQASRQASAPASTTSGDGRVEIVKMDRMRQIIAEHMVRSKSTSAHVTSFAEVDVTNLVRLRERNKVAFEKREGAKLTYTPFFVHAAVEALREHPILNASVEGDTIHLKKDFHIGIAVAIGKTGLVAPVIRDAGQRNVVGLALATADLADRARNKQLMPDQLSGGTFTVTNVGSLGSIMGTPIINQPQVGILAIGAIKKRPVVVEDPEFGDIIAVRHMMIVSLSYDHRIVDGAMGSSFLRKYTDVLEGLDPNAEI